MWTHLKSYISCAMDYLDERMMNRRQSKPIARQIELALLIFFLSVVRVNNHCSQMLAPL